MSLAGIVSSPLAQLEAWAQQYDIIGRIKQIENWRDNDAIPNLQTALSQLQQQANTLGDQQNQIKQAVQNIANQQTLINKAITQIQQQQTQIQKALQDASTAYQASQQAVTQAKTAYDSAVTALQKATDVNSIAQQAYNNATAAFNNAQNAINQASQTASSLSTYIQQQLTDLQNQGFSSFAGAIQTINSALNKAVKAFDNLKAGLISIRDRAVDVYNSFQTAREAFQQYGNAIGYRAAHILEPLYGAGHLFCLVNDVKWMLLDRGSNIGDPDLPLPAYSVTTYLASIQTAFLNLASALGNLVTNLG